MFTGRPYNTTKLPLVVLLLSNKTHAHFHFNTQFFIQSFYSFTTYVIFFQALLTCVMWEKELLCNKGILKHVYKIHFFNKQQKSTFKVYTYYLDKARPTYTPLKHDAEKLISLWLLNVSSQCFWYMLTTEELLIHYWNSSPIMRTSLIKTWGHIFRLLVY